ncbi:MAG: GAF domain-containing protein [Acidimicrobiia bacterium]
MLPRSGAGTDGAARRSRAAGSGSGRWAGSGRMAPARIAGGYALLALLWLLAFHGGRAELADTARAVEDVVFVAVTATVLWWVLCRRDRAIVARERQLARERRRVEAMSEDYGHGTIILQDGRISFASSSVGAMVGQDSAELVGRDASALLHPDDVERIARALPVAGSRPPPPAAGSPAPLGVTVAGRLQLADGTERWVRGVIGDHRGNPDVGGVVINLHDVDDLQRREHLISALLRGATSIAAAPTEPAVCEAFLAACIDATGLRLGAVRLLEGDVFTLAVSHDDEQLRPRQGPLPADGPTLGARAVRTGEAIVLESPEEVDALPAGSVPDGVRAACYVPMCTPQGCVGYLGLAATTAHRFDAPTRVALATFAQQAGLAVERVRLERAREQAVAAVTAGARRAEAVHHLTEAFSRAVRVDDVLEAAVNAIVDGLRPHTAAAVEVGAGGIRRVVQRGPVLLEDAGLRYDAYASLAQKVFSTARAQWFSTPTDLDRAVGDGGGDDPTSDRGPWSSGCCVPMRLDDEVVGVLIIGWPEARRLHGRERRLIELIATLCAEAVRRARLHDGAQDAAERHRQLSARYESLFRHHPHPLFVYDLDSLELLAVNDALLAAFRYDDPAALIGRPALQLFDPPAPPLPGSHPDADRLTDAHLLRLRRNDGSCFIAACTAHSAEGFAGRHTRVVACIDQTARIEAEEDRRRLEHRMVDIAERERRTLAEDLHDGPVQSLSAAAMWLTALRRSAERDEPVDGARLAAVEGIVIETIDGLRGTMMRLYPPTFDQLSLAEAIRDAIAESPLLSELDVDVEDNLRRPLDGPIKAALYRVVLEALANVRKHAGVRRSTVHLDEHDDVIEVRVSDHGVGMLWLAAEGSDDGSLRRTAHLGLSSMRDRVAMVGGDCHVEAVAGGVGTVVRARVPIGASGDGPVVVDAMGAD